MPGKAMDTLKAEMISDATTELAELLDRLRSDEITARAQLHVARCFAWLSTREDLLGDAPAAPSATEIATLAWSQRDQAGFMQDITHQDHLTAFALLSAYMDGRDFVQMPWLEKKGPGPYWEIIALHHGEHLKIVERQPRRRVQRKEAHSDQPKEP